MREIVGISDNFFNHVHAAYVKSFSNVIHYVANNLPDSFTQGQFLGILTNVLEQSSDGLIFGETPRDGKDVILDETDCGMCYLRREVPGLAFPESQILLALLEDHLYGPSHGINLVCLVKVNGGVCCNDSAPWCTLGTAHIEHPYGYTIDKGIHHDVAAPVDAAVPDSAFPGCILGNQRLGGEFLTLTLAIKRETHGLLAHLYHPQIMADHTPGRYEPENILARKPAVCQQVVKLIASPYGTSDHVLEKFYLAFCIVLNTLCGRGIRCPSRFLISPGGLLFRQGVVVLLPGFSDDLMVYHHLAPAVTDDKDKGLEAKYHLVAGVAKYTPDFFGVYTSFGKVCVIYDGADRESRVFTALIHPSPELTGDMVHYPAPVETVVVQEAVEDVLAGAAYLCQSGFRIVIWIFYQHTWKNYEN